jgi:hypothetical protein
MVIEDVITTPAKPDKEAAMSDPNSVDNQIDAQERQARQEAAAISLLPGGGNVLPNGGQVVIGQTNTTNGGAGQGIQVDDATIDARINFWKNFRNDQQDRHQKLIQAMRLVAIPSMQLPPAIQYASAAKDAYSKGVDFHAEQMALADHWIGQLTSVKQSYAQMEETNSHDLGKHL